MFHILAVDDDRTILELIQEVLEGPDCVVVLVSNPKEAAARFSQGHFDLVLTDLQMPGRNGLAVASDIRALDPDVPIILLTGSTSGELPSESVFAAGVTDLLQKPLRLSELRGVKDILARRARIQGGGE